MDAGFEKRAGRRRMQMVRRNDGDRVDRVGARRLGFGHGGEVRINAIRREAEILARQPRPLGIGGQCARDELPAVVEPGDHPVHRADERAASAADHAQPQAAVQPRVLRAFDHVSPNILRFMASSVPAPAKSSNALSVTRMIWEAMNSAPSRAPSSGCFRQHSHSSTAQPS